MDHHTYCLAVRAVPSLGAWSWGGARGCRRAHWTLATAREQPWTFRDKGRQGDDLMEPNHQADLEPRWVRGRDLSSGADPGSAAPAPDGGDVHSGSRVLLAALAAVLSAVAVLSIAVMLLRDQLAASAWPLLLAVVAVLAAAIALFGWWRRGSAAPRG